MVTAIILNAVGCWLKPQRHNNNDILKKEFTMSLLGAQHKRKTMKKKPTSSVDELLGKLFSGVLPSLRYRKLLGASCLQLAVVQYD